MAYKFQVGNSDCGLPRECAWNLIKGSISQHVAEASFTVQGALFNVSIEPLRLSLSNSVDGAQKPFVRWSSE